MVWVWAEDIKCKEGGTGRERWSVRVRALLSKKPLLERSCCQIRQFVFSVCLECKDT